MNKENYVGAMFTGKKRAKAEDAIPHSNVAAAFLMLALVFTGVAYFVRGFDLQTGVFRAPGTAFELVIGGEGEHHGGGGESHEGHDHDGHDHDGDDD
jgi:hypothetical protein